jgi:hypothetical protein
MFYSIIYNSIYPNIIPIIKQNGYPIQIKPVNLYSPAFNNTAITNVIIATIIRINIFSFYFP